MTGFGTEVARLAAFFKDSESPPFTVYNLKYAL